MDKVQLPRGRRVTKRNLLFIIKSPGVPGTHLIGLGRMKDLGAP